MDDKYLDEWLALQMAPLNNFIAVDKNEIYISIDERDRLEETLMNKAHIKNKTDCSVY